jgi:twin arginine-targeting protein translocase, TatA/E family
MGLSATHILLLLVVVVLLFGRGKISELMGDVAKGIKSFKKGMTDEEDEERRAAAAKPICDANKSTEAERTKTR